MVKLHKHSSPGKLLGIGLFLLLYIALPANAATITVSTTSDVLNGADGVCSLREAITNANNNAATYADCTAGEAAPIVDEIIVPAGTYTLTLVGVDETPLLSGATWTASIIANPAIGDLDITEDVKITGAGAGNNPALNTIIQWAAQVVTPPTDLTNRWDRIFHIQATTANITNVTITGMTLANGDIGLVPSTASTVCVGGVYTPANENAYDLAHTGACSTTPPTLQITQFRRMGGAIAIGSGAAVVTYEEAVHGPGGGGGSGGSKPPVIPPPEDPTAFAVGTVTLSDVIVRSNWSGADGGGIFNAAETTITNSIISGNFSGANGGGIYNDAKLTLQYSTLGKLFDATAAAELKNANQAENGGGIFDTGSHTTTIVGSAINGNTAVGGGGIAGRSGIIINIDNSTISGNVGTDVGAGITTNGTVNLRNVTIADNSATTDAPGGGAGLNSFGSGVFNFNNTILNNNTITGAATRLANCGCSGGSATCAAGVMNSGGYNVENGNTCSFLSGIATDLTNTDPKINSLANNGGLTETHSLVSGSPAIEGGTNVVCNVLVSVYGDVDQRGTGYPRKNDGNGDSTAVCDLGAFEAAAVSGGGGGGGGGGCSYNPNGDFDLLLPLLVLIGLTYLGWRRSRYTRQS